MTPKTMFLNMKSCFPFAINTKQKKLIKDFLILSCIYKSKQLCYLFEMVCSSSLELAM